MKCKEGKEKCESEREREKERQREREGLKINERGRETKMLGCVAIVPKEITIPLQKRQGKMGSVSQYKILSNPGFTSIFNVLLNKPGIYFAESICWQKK